MTIGKLDAATRQLCTASDLYFAGGDPVSIRTLTMAAYNVLRDLNKHRGGAAMMVKDQLVASMPLAERKAFAKKLNEPETFFKHADRDPEASLDLPDGGHQIEVLLFDAAVKVLHLSGVLPAELWLIYMWAASLKILIADDPDYNAWIQSVSRLPDELPPAYKERMWLSALRLGGPIRS